MNDTLSLQALFEGRIFKIPDYQRGYAWEEQQVGEFLDDLALIDQSRRHYTGTIVLHQPGDARKVEDSEGAHYVTAEVVDGQQRLTTIVLLINELSQALSEYPARESTARGVKKQYVVAKDTDGSPLHKLSLNQDTDSFFRASVLPAEAEALAGPTVKSAQRLLDAKQQIAKFLKGRIEENLNREQWLHGLLAKITTKLLFNLYEVEKELDVGVIFEVMNDRGKPLTDLEKVKNYLLYSASALGVNQESQKRLAKSVNETWGDILSQLMAADLSSPDNEDQLLRAHWVMEYNPQAKNWDGSKSIRKEFDLRSKDHKQLLHKFEGYVQGLRNACVSFCDAHNPDRTNAFTALSGSLRDQIIIWNTKLMRIGVVATFLPLLMAVRKRWPGEPGNYLEIVRICETLAFRTYRIGRYYSNYGQSAMFRLAFDTAQGMREFGEVAREVKRIYGSRAARHAFDAFIDPSNVHSWYKRNGLNYFLYEYEEDLAKERGGSPRVKWSEVERADTIEHILPVTISDRPYWQERFDSGNHEEYIHDIGNLTLTKGNSSLWNRPFPEKRGTQASAAYCYSRSLLLVERQIADKWHDWTVDTIDERRAMLLDWAKGRWYVDFSTVDGETYDPDEDEVAAQ